MYCKLITVCCSLITPLLFLLSCTPTPTSIPRTVLLIHRFEPPAFIEFSEDLQPVKETPFSIPPNCGLYNTFPAPRGSYLAIELNCPNGQTVLFLNIDSASVTQPVTDSDSHFLAWAGDGKAAYLKVDSLGNAHVARVHVTGDSEFVPITELTYDLSPGPGNQEFTFTFSRGLGQGSELWLAKRGGDVVEQMYADRDNYLSFARWSPDGKQIAFIKIPDTRTPFTVGELWVLPSTPARDADGPGARKLSDADAGHGYASNWSPEGKQIALVMRENPEDENADQSPDALISNIYVIDVESGELTRVTRFENGWAETPVWSPDGNTLAFNTVLNGRMKVQIAEYTTGEIRSLITGSTCCPAWLRK
jgi:Tol biopolymer transport system component